MVTKKKVSAFEFALIKEFEPENAKNFIAETNEEANLIRETKIRNQLKRFKTRTEQPT